MTKAYIYPVKSCGEVSVTELTIDDYGPVWDRHWMLVNSQGRFLSQRTHPQLSQVKLRPVDLQAGVFELSYPNLSPILLKPSARKVDLKVSVWKDSVMAINTGSELNEWFTQVIGQPCFLVENGREQSRRLVSPKYGEGLVQFADGFPLLLIGSASLDFLNQRLKEPVSMLRFRPNLVVKTNEPHIEDRWSQGEHSEGLCFQLVKKCSRCITVNVDPKTGQVQPMVLKALKAYRSEGHKIMFGQNLTIQGTGHLKVSDTMKFF